MIKQLTFSVVSGGVIYRSESGMQGYYPRVVSLSEDEFLCSFVGGTALESLDSHPVLFRSMDTGKAWEAQGPVDAGRSSRAMSAYTETGFISQGPDDTLFCLGGHWPIDSNSPDAPIIDSETCGMRRNRMVMRRSGDKGRTWTDPETVSVGIDAPLEIPTGVVTLSNGNMLISFSTWKEWDGSCPYGHRIMVIRSQDNGQTWSEPVTIFHDAEDKIGYWEGRISEMPGGRLIATCWAHDWTCDEDINNRFAISDDGGASWSAPAQMPVAGQTGWPMPISEDRVLFVYNHRKEPVGILGAVACLTGSKCTLQFGDMVFNPQVKTESTISRNNYAVTDFQFGAPSVVSLGGNKYMVVYWCVVQGRSGINWTMIELNQ